MPSFSGSFSGKASGQTIVYPNDVPNHELHLNEITCRNRRGPAVIDGVLQRLTRLLEQRCRSSLAGCEFDACNKGCIVHSQHEDRPAAIVDHGDDAGHILAPRFRLGRGHHLLRGSQRKHLLVRELRERILR